MRNKTLKLTSEAYSKLRELSESFDVSDIELLEAFISAVHLYKDSLKENLDVIAKRFDEPKVNALSKLMREVVNMGLCLNTMISQLLKAFNAEDLGFVVQEIDWLTDMEGLIINLSRNEGEKSWIDSVDLEFRRSGDAHATFVSTLDLDEGVDAEDIASRLKKALRSYKKTTKYKEIEEEFLDLDYGIKIYIEEDLVFGIIGPVAEVYVPRWNLLPSFRIIEEIFEDIYRRAGLEKHRLKTD